MANISFNYDHKVSPDSFFPVWIGKTTAIINNVTVLNNDRDIQIVVSSDFDYPETFNQLNPVVIKIAMSRLSYWAQAVYQYAHEYCHYLINSPLPSLRDEWFEEAICECCSRFALYQLSNDPLAKQLQFNLAFREYYTNLFKKKNQPFNLADLSNDNSSILQEMRNNHEDRDKFNYIANQIYPIIRENNTFWRSIYLLSGFNNNRSFIDNMSYWYQAAPATTKKQIREIIKLMVE